MADEFKFSAPRNPGFLKLADPNYVIPLLMDGQKPKGYRKSKTSVTLLVIGIGCLVVAAVAAAWQNRKPKLKLVKGGRRATV